MKREELIKWLDDEIIHSAELCEDGDAKHWGMEEGILISRNEAEEIRTYLSLPPAEGAETILKEGLDDGRYADIVDGINIDVKQPFYQAIIRYAEDVVAAQQQPTAEGAEEILLKHGFFVMTHKEGSEHVRKVFIEPVIAAMQEFATLHAQRIAEKMVSERMKKVESLLNMAAGLVGNPCTNISSSCDIACDDWQGEYNEYLKSKEK